MAVCHSDHCFITCGQILPTFKFEQKWGQPTCARSSLWVHLLSTSVDIRLFIHICLLVNKEQNSPSALICPWNGKKLFFSKKKSIELDLWILLFFTVKASRDWVTAEEYLSECSLWFGVCLRSKLCNSCFISCFLKSCVLYISLSISFLSNRAQIKMSSRMIYVLGVYFVYWNKMNSTFTMHHRNLPALTTAFKGQIVCCVIWCENKI